MTGLSGTLARFPDTGRSIRRLWIDVGALRPSVQYGENAT